MKRKYKPSLWWIALAPIILIVGVGGGTTILLTQILNQGGEETFVAPMTRTFDIESPGTYIVSHDYKIVFRGKSYDRPAALPDKTFISLKGKSGELEMDESWGSGSTSGEHERKEVGRYSIEEAGAYTLSISGLTDPHVMTFSQSVIGQIILAAIASFILNIAGWFGAPAIVIIVLSRRLLNRRKFRSENPELFEDE